MKLTWSEEAARGFDEIIERRAQRSVEATRKFVDGLIEHTLHLIDHPQMGRMVPEVGRSDIRELIHLRHRIVYRVDVDTVEILSELGLDAENLNQLKANGVF